uniref:Ribosomal protein S14 n=1 Tax=Ulva compressa TaxID=63659 RepID=A0A3S6PAD6_ULVCO|nr:ribosomal protein S14 [Ulva compressa]ARO34891.1 ribosomal protein S14 [Ulva compressa]ATP01463.1 ribosomal protein S14 [Ulva compressa]AZP40152.1 ribosomal protein S14 [Ulva compressa]QDF43139.1 ribosomal protein S14 [Ulva compressa]
MTVLKNNYNFNTITKNQKYLGLLKQSKARFSASLLNKTFLNLKTICFSSKLNTTASASIKNHTIDFNKYVKNLTQANWSNFVYTKRTANRKQIQTNFRSIISDQKKRLHFDNHELTGILLKSLLCVDLQASLKSLDNSANSFTFARTFDRSPKARGPKARDQALNNSLPYAGPGLILEQLINRQFTKKQVISKIRNRCIITGRSSIIGKFRLSRISFRCYAGRGLIPGLIKTSD